MTLNDQTPPTHPATIAGAMRTSAVRVPALAARTAASAALTAPMECPTKTTRDAFRVRACATSPLSAYFLRWRGRRVKPKPGWSCASACATSVRRASAGSRSSNDSDVKPKPCEACMVTAPGPPYEMTRTPSTGSVSTTREF